MLITVGIFLQGHGHIGHGRWRAVPRRRDTIVFGGTDYEVDEVVWAADGGAEWDIIVWVKRV